MRSLIGTFGYNKILEQLVIFLPALVAAAMFGNAFFAAPVGLLFVIGRGLYARAYVREPSSRTRGIHVGLWPI